MSNGISTWEDIEKISQDPSHQGYQLAQSMVANDAQVPFDEVRQHSRSFAIELMQQYLSNVEQIRQIGEQQTRNILGP